MWVVNQEYQYYTEDMSVHIRFFLSQRSQNSGSRKTDTLWWEEKKLWAPRLQRKEFFQFYYKKLEKRKPVSMASSQRYNPSLARFVAGCTSSMLRDPLSPTRQHFYSALSEHFKVPWGMVICFLTGWPSYFKSQLMFLLVFWPQSCVSFGWSAPELFSDKLY